MVRKRIPHTRGSDLTVTDMFCGAGGSSIGAVASGARLRMGPEPMGSGDRDARDQFPRCGPRLHGRQRDQPAAVPANGRPARIARVHKSSLAKGAKRKGLSQFDAFVPVTDDPRRRAQSRDDVGRAALR